MKIELTEGELSIKCSKIVTTIKRENMILYIQVREEGIASPFNTITIPIPATNNVDLVKVLKTPVEDISLSVRTYNSLKAAKINTLKELVEYELEDLMKFRHFGQKSICEVEEELHKRGLRFGMNTDELFKYNLTF